MSKPRFDHKELVHKIMEDKDVPGAMAHILQVTKGDQAKRRRAVFDNVRTRILKQEQYRDPEGYAQLQIFAMRSDLNPTDRVKLQTLLFKPLHFIRWAQVTRTFLTTPELQEQLAAIKIVKDPFYKFDCPENIKVLVMDSIREGITENHSHRKKPRENYRFTNQEVDDMIEEAQNFINQELDWKKRATSLRVLEALCLLTGRRKWELCSSLKIRTVNVSEYQADVQGLGKLIKTSFQEDWIRIPLLAPISTVIRGLTNLRLYPDHQMGRYVGFKKMFPKLTHTHYRNLYSEKCYELRETNKFCHGDSCSKLEWQRRALHVSMSILANRYCTMLITDESDEQQTDLAGEVCGSQDQDSQDSLRCERQHSYESGRSYDEHLSAPDEGSHDQTRDQDMA
jgi:hypothetical protein